MENVWHLLNNNNNTSGERGQNNHSTTNNPHHHEWQLGNNLAQPYNFINNATPTPTPTTTIITHCVQDGGNYGPMFPHHHHIYSSSSSSTLFGTSSNESGGSTYYHPDPHLPSLKLGKRHYFENANNNNNNNVVVINGQPESEVIKKMKNLINGQEQFSWGGYGGLIWQPPSTSTATGPTMAPRCQVEGCSVMLVDAKYYHKRHKVCEKHSKAPKVMVLGIEQRFCQQCSRFHAISEFDESKRSCRRRLAGHNERRRKSSQDQSAAKNLTPDKVMGGGCGYLPLLSTSSAHSVMSSYNTRFNSSPELSEQSSAALRELIVENRAAFSAWQVHDGHRHSSWRNHPMEDQIETHQNHRINFFSSEGTESGCWEDMNAGAHLSLDHQAGSNNNFSI